MATTDPAPDHDRQIAFWNGPGGDAWTESQEAQDRLLAPISSLLLAQAAVRTGERVIDVGCGCGVTCLDLAAVVGPHGHVLGIDVSQRMLARAEARKPAGAPIDFVAADVTTYPFPPCAADVAVSRFGVMFFTDPRRAFANLRSGLRTGPRTGGRLVFCAWREPKRNPWAMVPLQAAYAHVPKLPAPGPDGPGLFSFASEDRVRRLLTDAGFCNVVMTPHQVEFDLAGGQGLEAATRAVLDFGPTLSAIEGQPADKRAAVAAAVRAALTPFVDGDTVRLSGEIWLVAADNL